MASTYSALKIELIGTGDQTGTWGNTTNVNLGDSALGEAITGSADVAFSSADVTITLVDTNATQSARNLRLNLTGTSGGARNLILGSGCQIEKLYLVNNGLADAVTVKNTTGTGIAVAAGKTMFVYNNGTNVVDAITHLTSLTTGVLSASGATTFTAGTASTSTTTGTAVITGGLGVSGRVNAANFDGIVGANTAAAGSFTTINASTSITNAGLTSGRVTFAGTSGLLSDNANFVYDGNNLIIGNSTDALGSNRLYVQSANTAANNRTVSVYNTAATSTATFANRLMQISSNGSGADVNLFFSDQVAFNAYIGMNSGALYFGTNGTNERMRITSTGLVGIGTSSPSRLLQLSQSNATTYTSDFDNTPNQLYLVNTNTTTNAYTGIQMDVGSNSQAAISAVRTADGEVAMTFGTRVAGSRAERMRISSSGDLIVGGTSVVYDLANRRVITINGSSAAAVGFTVGAVDKGILIHTGTDMIMSNTVAGAITFQTTNTERMRIDSSGNVGIGTSSPQNFGKFGVSGVITVNSLSGISAGFSDGTTGTLRIAHASSQNIINFDSGNLCFQGGGSGSPVERMRIDSSGNVLVGSTSVPTGIGQRVLQVTNGTNGAIILGSGATLSPNPRIFGSDTYDLALAAGVTTGKMLFYTNDTERMRITSTGNLIVGTSALSQGKVGILFDGTVSQGLVIRTSLASSGSTFVQFENSTGALQGFISAATTTTTSYNTGSSTSVGAQLNASGITFPATQIASADVNTLDDYEEGTWTPTCNAGATLTLTGSPQYTKIGRQVTIHAEFSVSVNVSGTQFQISGVPFASNNSTGNSTGVTLGYFAVDIAGYLPSNASTITFQNLAASANKTNAEVSGNYFIIACTYFTA